MCNECAKLLQKVSIWLLLYISIHFVIYLFWMHRDAQKNHLGGEGDWGWINKASDGALYTSSNVRLVWTSYWRWLEATVMKTCSCNGIMEVIYVVMRKEVPEKIDYLGSTHGMF